MGTSGQSQLLQWSSLFRLGQDKERDTLAEAATELAGSMRSKSEVYAC